MQTTAYKIDTNIPVPQDIRAKPDGKTTAIRNLEVNQSVFFPGMNNASGLVRNVKLKFADRDFTTQKRKETMMDDTVDPPVEKEVEGVRVWRVK